MSRSWATHLPHFLNEKGAIPEELPVPARQLAKALCAFIMYATNFDDMEDAIPRCFVVIKKKRCRGRVQSLLSLQDDNIVWQCEACNSWGTISGWQGTLWDLTNHCELH